MNTILVLTDFSKRAEHAAEFALTVAKKTNSEILLYNAVFTPNVVPAETTPPYLETRNTFEQSAQKLENLTKKLVTKSQALDDESFSPVINYLNEIGSITGNVPNLLARRKIWMIIMGDKSKEGMLDRFILGSDTYYIVEKSKCPVILVPENVYLTPLKKIAFATDLFDPDYNVLEFVADFARHFEAEITVIHVTAKSKENNAETAAKFEEMKARVDYPNMLYEEIRGEKIAKALAEFSQIEHVDMLVMIHKHRPFFERIFHASKTKELMNYHKVPLMIFPNVFI